MQVSVIIPIFNAFPFLDKSIQSALDQPQTGEVILVDDRSTDGSWEKCQEWVRRDIRVKLFKNEGPKGAGAARNVGLRYATCEYVAFLDADDYYLEARFDDDLDLFKKNKAIDGVSNAVIILTWDNADHQILNTIYKHKNITSYLKDYTIINIEDLILHSDVFIHGCTFTKEFIFKLEGFDENLKQCQDTDLIRRAVCEGKIFSSRNKPKTVYYIHSSNTIKNEKETLVYRIKFEKKSFWYMVAKGVNWEVLVKLLKSFSELCFLQIFGNKMMFKKLIKVLISPFILYQLIKSGRQNCPNPVFPWLLQKLSE